MRAYSALAEGYEKLFGEENEKPWQNYVVERVKRYAANSCGIDIGCGTGFITRSLYDNGFSVTGVDCSPEMLNAAYLNFPGIPFILCKAQNIRGFYGLGFATAINETISYLSAKDMLKAFMRINACLTDGGFFMFDIASEYKLKNVLANNEFTSDGDIPYIWRNTLKGDRVNIDLTCFYPDGDKYVRKDESQTQYIHAVADVEKMLKTAGFTLVKKEGHLGKRITKTVSNINFLAKKA